MCDLDVMGASSKLSVIHKAFVFPRDKVKVKIVVYY